MTRFSQLLALALLLVLASPAVGQDLTPRFGIGFQGTLSTEDGFGIGARGRVSTPLNADLSVAGSLGFTGFVLDGTEDAVYLFDPQASLIITFPPTGNRASYLLAGVGGYFTNGGSRDADDVSGPSVHLGLGQVQRLNETSLFYEVEAELILGSERVGLAVPLRIGIIF